MNEREPIGVVGAGWVGLVTAACFAELGHPVVVREIVDEKVESLRRGEAPIHEPGLSELVVKNAARLTFTTDMEELLGACRLVFICVQTPPTASGDADLAAVMKAVEEIGDGEGRALVMKSTVPVGTGGTIRRHAPGLAYVSCPEFLREGSAVKDFLEPDRVVIGADPGDEWAADAVAGAYEPLGAPIVRTDVASAEMIKLASNAFLATKISFINEIANVCDQVGADVTEVARGMGMDSRIGPKFLNAGLGFGGSCLVGDERVMIRRHRRTRLVAMSDLYDEIAAERGIESAEVSRLDVDDLDVVSVDPETGASSFYPVECLTRRNHDGELVDVRTKMGRRLRTTADHPFVVADSAGAGGRVVLAADLGTDDWLPLATGSISELHSRPPRETVHVAAGASAAGIESESVIVRTGAGALDPVRRLSAAERSSALDHPRGSLERLYDITRSGSLRLSEALTLRVGLQGALAGTARNGTYVPLELPNDEALWRVIGLYLAEGHVAVDGDRRRIQWSFHPTQEDELVGEVADYWRSHGVKATVRRGSTTKYVQISSRILAAWWTEILGLGRNCYEQRIPDLAWGLPEGHQRALLSGMWLGDGSWSYVSRGPSVALEYGTASPELADGLLRLLAANDLVARLKVGRTAKSTTDNYWITISGADQVERALFLVPESERREIRESIARQAKRIAPTGYRTHPSGTWVRVVSAERRPFSGPVFSMHVPGVHTFAATGGLVTHNCFPKDTQALKMLAGNIGYHFQLLSSVIEVNELQKRRVIAKLTRHLDSLEGRRIALLGLAFKPDTDDMREASSLVLAARLQGEGATVTAYDPVAAVAAGELMPGVEMSESAVTALDDADAAVLVTEWPEFAELDWADVRERMSTPLLVDGRNFLDAGAIRAAGLVYEGIGRPSVAPDREEAAG